jgi:hypothetical protein
MNRFFGFALLAAGVVLIFLGVNASESFASDVSRFFTGSPTNKAVWFLVSGIASVILGLFITMGVIRNR